jgi:hypothetical protein
MSKAGERALSLSSCEFDLERTYARKVPGIGTLR